MKNHVGSKELHDKNSGVYHEHTDDDPVPYILPYQRIYLVPGTPPGAHEKQKDKDK